MLLIYDEQKACAFVDLARFREHVVRSHDSHVTEFVGTPCMSELG